MDQRRIDELVNAPAEGLNVEIKRWISPNSSEGINTIVKACFALRNRNGGFLLIGFDNTTLLPHNDERPSDVRGEFNLDKIQGLVSKYASAVFEIAVGFGERGGLEYPVIAVPEGVTAPVAAKRDLKSVGGKFLIREGDVYFRTLLSNGTPSSAKAHPKDWSEIMAVCFDNREADIGRFFRRHLAGESIETLINALSKLRESASAPVPTLADRAKTLLSEGEQMRLQAIEGRDLSPEQAAMTRNAAWSIGLAIDPPHSDAPPDQSFLRTAMAANPQYTGWPIWLDSRGFADVESRPKVVAKGWQALIIPSTDWFKHADFMRLDPTGKFYIWSALQDDLTEKIPPGTVLDVILVILRVAEAIAVGLSISKALGWQSGAMLGFAFRWTGVKGRELASWANPLVSIMPWNKAEDSSVDTYVEVPFDTPLSAIATFVNLATRDLFIAFNGYTLPMNAIEHWTQRLIERRL